MPPSCTSNLHWNNIPGRTNSGLCFPRFITLRDTEISFENKCHPVPCSVALFCKHDTNRLFYISRVTTVSVCVCSYCRPLVVYVGHNSVNNLSTEPAVAGSYPLSIARATIWHHWATPTGRLQIIALTDWEHCQEKKDSSSTLSCCLVARWFWGKWS